MLKKILFIFLIIFIALSALGIFFFLRTTTGRNFLAQNMQIKGAPVEQKPTLIKVGDKKKVKYPQDYTIVLVGDSMTERMGNSDELKINLKKYFPKKSFEVLNYGFGSTNILSVQKRLEEETFFGRSFRPIMDIDIDLILIESFGHNPLSQFPLNEGLIKQNEALDKMIETIKSGNPKTKITFVATIAPNRFLYGTGQVDLTPEQRRQWAEERMAYIKNHMEFAKSHNIPLIDIYSKSIDSNGDGKTDYVSKDDNIHPSPNGIYLISDEIARYIFEKDLLDIKN